MRPLTTKLGKANMTVRKEIGCFLLALLDVPPYLHCFKALRVRRSEITVGLINK